MKKLIYLFICLVPAMMVQAQPENPDSLIRILNSQKLTLGEQMSVYERLRDIYSENDAVKSNFYARKGLLLAEKMNDLGMASVFNGQIGVNYYTMSIYDTATVYLERAVDLAVAAKDHKQEGSANIDLGNLYRRQNKYQPALEKYMRAMEVFDSIGNKGNCAIALINISDIHGLLSDHARELHFLKQAEEAVKTLETPNLKMIVYYRFGNICNRDGRYDEALKYATEANGISRSLANKKYEIATLKLIAISYAKLKNYDESMKYAGQCIQLAEGYDDKRLLAGVSSDLSDIYLEQKRYREYAGLSHQVWLMDSTDLIYGTNTAQALAIANIYLENRDKALYYLQKFSDMIIQRTDKNTHDALIEMEVKYETEKKETRIMVLEKEKQLYAWLGLAGIIVVLSAFGMFFYRHRMTVQKRKAAEHQHALAQQRIKQLEQEKQLVATQAVLDGEVAERSRLSRDLHDGLGGLLSVVKLNLKEVKGYSIMDGTDGAHFGKALEMLDESIGELRRVAHHIMPESLMRYGLRVSLDDFCRAIPGAGFQYYGSADRLDSRMEVLLYRCTYELVNNAVKYAEASIIDVQLITGHGLISLTVRDNGCGFDPAAVVPGAGLENIRTRVSAYNGRLDIHTMPGKGTEVSIEIADDSIIQ